MNFALSPRFLRSLYKLPKNVIDLTKEKLEIFFADPWEPALKTHKLHGTLENHWSFSVNYEYRAIFRHQNGGILLIDIGLHDDVY